jgi:hypothetical protein
VVGLKFPLGLWIYQRWAKADVFFINDLLKNEGGFLSLKQFQDKYGIILIFF